MQKQKINTHCVKLTRYSDLSRTFPYIFAVKVRTEAIKYSYFLFRNQATFKYEQQSPNLEKKKKTETRGISRRVRRGGETSGKQL